MSGHTELPWRNIRGRIISDVLPRDGSHDVCSMTVVNNDVARAEANAELIVTACNSHADLVRALEAASAEITDSARIICQEYDRKTRKYVFNDDLWKAKLPGSFSTIVQIRTALATLTARKG